MRDAYEILLETAEWKRKASRGTQYDSIKSGSVRLRGQTVLSTMYKTERLGTARNCAANVKEWRPTTFRKLPFGF